MDYDVAKDSNFPVSRKATAVQSAESDEEQEDDDEEEAAVKKQQQSDSDENDDDEEEDDDEDDEESLIRRRREAVKEPAETETAAEPAATDAAAAAEESTVVPTTRKPVLVLIRDALKKVTTGLPTEQVANNALQYFQLFEHFIQQTIEQVIDAADDDEDEVPATVAPSTNEGQEEDKKPVETKPEEATDESKPDETTGDAKPTEQAPAVPVETPAEKPVVPAAASNSV